MQFNKKSLILRLFVGAARKIIKVVKLKRLGSVVDGAYSFRWIKKKGKAVPLTGHGGP
jgi:hypothetical protein